MFIQLKNSDDQLFYVTYESIVAFNEDKNVIWLSSGASFALASGQVRGLMQNMLRAGKIAGLGHNAINTQNYPFTGR